MDWEVVRYFSVFSRRYFFCPSLIPPPPVIHSVWRHRPGSWHLPRYHGQAVSQFWANVCDVGPELGPCLSGMPCYPRCGGGWHADEIQRRDTPLACQRLQTANTTLLGRSVSLAQNCRPTPRLHRGMYSVQLINIQLMYRSFKISSIGDQYKNKLYYSGHMVHGVQRITTKLSILSRLTMADNRTHLRTVDRCKSG